MQYTFLYDEEKSSISTKIFKVEHLVTEDDKLSLYKFLMGFIKKYIEEYRIVVVMEIFFEPTLKNKPQWIVYLHFRAGSYSDNVWKDMENYAKEYKE